MKTLDCLILKPGNQKSVYGRLSDYDLTAYEPPLWSCLLAGFLREKGYAVEVLDAEIEALDCEAAARAAADRKARLTLMSVSGTNPSASTMNMSGAGAILRRIHELEPEMRTVYHGLHPTALPERTMKEEEVDFVCVGEGFLTLPPLIDAIKAGVSDFSSIPGLWWREENGALGSTQLPAPWKDLDALPRPAWDLLPMERYRAHNWHSFGHIAERGRYAVLYTSLGCPFKCSFCCINALFGKPGFRARSTESVMAELDWLVERYGVKNVKIIDEMFAINEKRVEEMCGAIASRGYDLNFWAYARVDTISPRMLANMKKAGINWVAYGFEAGNKKVLQGVSKGYDIEKTMGVVKATYDAGQYICANFIFGLPDDDYDSMQETLDSCVAINAEWANLYCTMAYPGSKLYQEAVAQGLELPRTWQEYSQYAPESRPLPTKHLQPGEILAFRDYAFHAYHENPRYLAKIHRLFGPECVEHIKKMSVFHIDRKLKQFSSEG